MEHLFIVIYRYSATDRWQPKVEGLFTERRLAENFAEILRTQTPKDWEYAVVEGSTLPVAQEALADF